MRLSDWRKAAPYKDSMAPKVLATIDDALLAMGAERDPECYIMWGDDPAARYLIFVPTASWARPHQRAGRRPGRGAAGRRQGRALEPRPAGRARGRDPGRPSARHVPGRDADAQRGGCRRGPDRGVRAGVVRGRRRSPDPELPGGETRPGPGRGVLLDGGPSTRSREALEAGWSGRASQGLPREGASKGSSR